MYRYYPSLSLSSIYYSDLIQAPRGRNFGGCLFAMAAAGAVDFPVYNYIDFKDFGMVRTARIPGHIDGCLITLRLCPFLK